jgi:hypothetical protein
MKTGAGRKECRSRYSHSIISRCAKHLTGSAFSAHADLNTVSDTVRISCWRIDDAEAHHQPTRAGMAPRARESPQREEKLPSITRSVCANAEAFGFAVYSVCGFARQKGHKLGLRERRSRRETVDDVQVEVREWECSDRRPAARNSIRDERAPPPPPPSLATALFLRRPRQNLPRAL